MKCYNPLYRLYDVLDRGEDTGDLIGFCEAATSIDDFVSFMVNRYQNAYYIRAESEDKVREAAHAFATWWKHD